jgi:hypothetical protein
VKIQKLDPTLLPWWILVLALAGTVYGYSGCNAPCLNGACIFGDPPPHIYEQEACIWSFYNAGNIPAPSPSLFTWVAKGDCTVDGDEPRSGFIAPYSSACVYGDTDVIWSPGTDAWIRYIYVMEGSETSILHHELLHAWLALTGRVGNGDGEHKRPEWGYYSHNYKGLLDDAVIACPPWRNPDITWRNGK